MLTKFNLLLVFAECVPILITHFCFDFRTYNKLSQIYLTLNMLLPFSYPSRTWFHRHHFFTAKPAKNWVRSRYISTAAARFKICPPPKCHHLADRLFGEQVQFICEWARLAPVVLHICSAYWSDPPLLSRYTIQISEPFLFSESYFWTLWCRSDAH